MKAKPSLRGALPLLLLLWSIPNRAVREFVWGDLKAGLIDLRGLPRSAQWIAGVGFALLTGLIASLLLSEVWRMHFELVPLSNSAPGRGTLVPAGFIPLIGFVLALAWSLALLGAMRAHPLIRWGVVGLFVIVSVSFLGTASRLSLAGVGWAGLIAVIALVLVRSRRAPRPALEFPLLLIATGLIFAEAEWRSSEIQQISGMSLGLDNLVIHLQFLAVLTYPLLLGVGLSMAGFAYQAAHWTTRAVSEQLPRVVGLVVVAIVLALRFLDAWGALLAHAEGDALALLRGLAGGAGVLGCVGLSGLLVRWSARSTLNVQPADVVPIAERAGAGIIVGFLAVSLLSFGLLGAANAVFTIVPVSTETAALLSQAAQLQYWLNAQITPSWQYLFAALALLGGLWLARRQNQGLALYLVTFGLVSLWLDLTKPPGLLFLLEWRGSRALDAVWMTALVVCAGVWLARRQLTFPRAAALLFGALVTGLIQQTDFLEDRFSPVLGFAGIGFLAFGLAWDALTVGAWANVDSPALPRMSRLFLYLGYVLLTAVLANWAMVTHDIAQVNLLTGDLAVLGFVRFGQPMLYAALLVALMRTEPAHP